MTPEVGRAAREAALQVLYLAEVGGASPALAIEAYFDEHQPDASADVRARTEAIVGGASRMTPELDDLIGRHATHWRVERLAILDRLILRIAAWELQETPPLPAAIVINEALELARRFSTDESVSFVNGVLDAVRRTLNPQNQNPSNQNPSNQNPPNQNPRNPRNPGTRGTPR